MDACGLYLGEKEIGRLTWTQTDGKLRLRGVCPAEPGLIYRLHVQTERGERRLGVMLPEEGRFVLSREIPAGEVPLSACIDRTLPGEEHLPGLPLALSAFSQIREDTLPADCGERVKAAVWKDTRYLLFPLVFGTSCPQAPWLCITTVIDHQGRFYGVFCEKQGQFLPLSDRLRPADVL